MADTQRTLSEILDLMVIDGVNEISAQDIRDAVVSQAASYGQIGQTTFDDTTISTSSTFVTIGGTYQTDSTLNRNFDMNSNGQLRYIGAAKVVAVAIANITVYMNGAGGGSFLRFRVDKNNASGAGQIFGEGYINADVLGTVTLID